MRLLLPSCLLLVLTACASEPKTSVPAAVPPPAATNPPPAQPAPASKPSEPASTAGGSASTKSTETQSSTPATVSNKTTDSTVDAELARAMKTHTKVVRDGKVLYCRRDASMGSRITTTKCLTEAQLEDEVRTAADAKRRLGLPRSGPCSSTGAAC